MSEITQLYIISVLQVLLAGGLINVWIVRFNKPTKYRGKGAGNMKDEFSRYGLPVWFMYVVGFFKIFIALVMILAIFLPYLMYPFGFPALILLVVLMIGAISMHIKVRDPFVRAVPALLMLAMALAIVLLVRVF